MTESLTGSTPSPTAPSDDSDNASAADSSSRHSSVSSEVPLKVNVWLVGSVTPRPGWIMTSEWVALSDAKASTQVIRLRPAPNAEHDEIIRWWNVSRIRKAKP